MPLISESWHEPTHASISGSWLNKAANRRDIALLRETVKRLERSSREQLMLESESQDTFNHLYAQAGSMKRAITAMSNAIDSELLALRTEVHELRDDLRRHRDRESSSAAAATEAVAEAQKVLVELASSHRIERELRTTRDELAQLKGDHTDLLNRHTQLHELVTGRLGDLATDGTGVEADGALSETREQLSTLRREHDALRRKHDTWREDAAAQLAALHAAAEAASATSRDLVEGALEGTRAELAEASGGLARNREAIQHIADMVTANSAEDEATAARLNARIDEAANGFERGRSGLDAEMLTLRQAIQHVADMVSTNSAEDEQTAAALNQRIDQIEQRLPAA